jgi:hypothetical protein
VWRGDRTARATPPFGHALIGVGLGIVYLSLYLGHFTLHVLDARVALGLLAAVSLASVLLGLHYRVQTVALLGVIGAFLPQLLAAAMPLRGMALTPWMLLLYLSAVDAVVLVLAAQAGWGGLSLTALLLTGFTWAAAFGSQMFGWGIRIGQAVQFAAFGLALLPRLVVLPRRVRPIELAVVVLAPLAWLGVAAPFLVRVSATAATLFLLAHALLYLAAAFWVEPRRTDEDLWRPLTGAATLFLTVALALWLGEERAGVGWSTEGVVLLWLGLRSRSGWLRGCGIVVASLGALLLTGEMASSAWRPDQMPVFYTAGVRNLLGLAVLGAGAVILARARPGLSLGEQALSRAWTVMVNVLFLAWSAQEASHLARTLEASGGRWAHAPEFAAPPEHERVRTLSAVFTSATWTLQAGILLAIGWRIGSSFARWLALGLLGLTVLKFLFLDLQRVDAFWRFLTAIVVGAALLAISYAYQRKGRRAAA